MTNRDGGPAFPDMTIDWLDSGARHVTRHSGMTLRDWFAGQALAGYASNCDETGLMAWQVENMVRIAYQTADAMLAARDAEAGE